MNILDRYIIREHIGPFFISISLIMFLFTLNLALRMLGRIVGQGLEFGIIIEYFFLNLAWILTLAVPMGVLVATLMAFGRMAGDREIVAMKSAGVGIVRMIRPAMIAALVVAGFSLYFQDQILPDMNYRNKLLTSSIRRKKPNVVLREGIFTRDLPKQTLLVKDIREGSDMLNDVTIFDESDPSEPSTVIADSGQLLYVDTLGMYQFHLYEGEIHQMKRKETEGYEILRFERALFRIDSPDQVLQRSERGYRGDRELSLSGLLGRVEELKKRKNPERYERSISRYMVEYHKKWAISAAALVFVLIGAPLGVRLTHGGLGVSGPLAVFFFLLYWSFLIGGENLADRMIVGPAISMWAANILLTIVGLYLIRLEIRQHSTLRLPWQRKRTQQEAQDTRGWSQLSQEEMDALAQQELKKVEAVQVDPDQMDNRPQPSGGTDDYN
ncbi:LptF/LptG family permease [bacterium]|nr:LptF/LptG family permease [bacterium]